jgi:hypothetical protein
MVSATIASMIKAVPGVGTIAGGLMQGTVQALITRWIGGVFIRYFKEEMKPAEGLAGLARQEWRRVTSVAEVRRLIQATRRHLADQDDD